jgi:tripartite-type tricarboxylate transporter receptor subunit TctC
LRAIAITSADASALVPGLPTIAASGVPGYEMTGATGFWSVAKTPAPIITRLNQEVVRYLNRPEVKERFLKAQFEVVASSPEEFAARIKSDIAKWGKVFKEAGIKFE